MHVVYPKTLNSLSLSSSQVEMLQHYLETVYLLDPSPKRPSFSLCVGESCDEFKSTYSDVLGKGFLFITAWNPGSKLLSATENENRQNSLLKDLSEYFVVTGVGRSKAEDWHEDSFGVFNVGQATAMYIGAQYGQNAVVWCGPESQPVLLLCSDFFVG